VKYGLPYRGSKSIIAKDIIAALPPADYLYDLFAGGCAITHCALESGKYKKVFVNDLNTAPQLFLDALNGKYRNEKRWISREQFHAEKETNPYIRWIWSFGNGGRSYLFGKDIEILKKAAHEYLFKNGYDGTKEKRIKLIKQFKADKKIKGRFELQQLQQLQQLEQLERLQKLQQLERLERLERRMIVSQKDYRKIKIKSHSVIYCDIPYCHKLGYKEKYYGIEFDAEAFYNWARAANFPVYFSSVYAPKDFKVVWKKETQCKMINKNSRGKRVIVERLFWNGVTICK